MTDFDTATVPTQSVSRMVVYLPDSDEWQRNLVAAIFLLTLPSRYNVQSIATPDDAALVGAGVFASIHFTENHARWGVGAWGGFQWA